MSEENKTDETQGELIPLKRLENPMQIFEQTEMDKLIDEIKKKTQDFTPDTSTDKGRKEIASMAYKVSTSKTALVKLSKELTDDMRTKVKAVDAVRIKMSSTLDDLRDEVRKPLTDYEEAEAARMEKLKSGVSEMTLLGQEVFNQWQSKSMIDMVDAQKKIQDTHMGDHWGEYAGKAAEQKEVALDLIAEAISKREKYDQEQKELEEFREQKRQQAAKEEKERIDRENKERADAAAKEAEDAAKFKADEAAKQLASENAEIQRKKDEELAQAKQAENDAKEEADRNAQKLKEAEEQGKRDAEAAAKKAADEERQKIADEENQRLADEKRREENKEHQRKINQEAVKGLVDAGIQKPVAECAVKAIILGDVPHVKLSY